MPVFPRTRERQRTSSPPGRGFRLPPGSVLLLLTTLLIAGTLGLIWPTANSIYCDRMAPLAVLAALSAAMIALCFRGLAVEQRRLFLGVALLLASVSLFASARFIARYRGACSAVEQQLQQLKRAS